MPLKAADLVPVPQEVQARRGTFDVRDRCWLTDARSAADVAVAWKLREELGVKPGVSAALPEFCVAVGSPPERDNEPPPREQGYLLHVTTKGLVVRGHDAEGLYWGLVTLEQLLAGGREVPCVRILDWPAFPLRGHHDDISRKQVSTLPDFLRIIRLLSRFKVNVYTPYMEDMLYLKSHPDVGRGRGRLTPAEVAAMHQEAERHKVVIMPTYSLIGHQENLLANPKYAGLGREVFQAMSSLDVRKPEVREFLGDVIRDVCELFPGPYFHAAFDETQGIEAEEFLDHANWCAREVGKYGKMMPMWVDMIYNHFGCGMIRELEENAIPVNWQYGCTDDVPHLRELAEQGRPVWGLAGYGNGGCFLPMFSRGKSNIDCWSRAGREADVPALFSSQWGDGGYENHRDMCWNMFAYLGEATWSGARARRKDFERRFQLSFYGTELPELTEVIEQAAGRLSLRPREFWGLFRCNAFSLSRWAAENPDALAGLEADEEEVARALDAVERSRAAAVTEREHLEHFRVALVRTLSVVQRLKFALKRAAGMPKERLRRECVVIQETLRSVRDAYEADWLRTNKRPNVEVSLGVYDEVIPTYDDLPGVKVGQGGRRDGYYALDLSDRFDVNFLPVAGLPIGDREVNGVPFLFADERRTHAVLTAESEPAEVSFPEVAIRDVHLIIAAHRVHGEDRPSAVLELLRGGEVVHSEEMMNVLHLCDWWAPLGEHIWAGGGMAHVDRRRVRYALKPGHMYGLAEVLNFAVPGGTTGDALRVRALGEEEVRLFAATLELAESGGT